ncbi:MAG: hypothetical protein Q9221_003100 [Calogaya cf. arnoldii]
MENSMTTATKHAHCSRHDLHRSATPTPDAYHYPNRPFPYQALWEAKKTMRKTETPHDFFNDGWKYVFETYESENQMFSDEDTHVRASTINKDATIDPALLEMDMSLEAKRQRNIIQLHASRDKFFRSEANNGTMDDENREIEADKEGQEGTTTPKDTAIDSDTDMVDGPVLTKAEKRKRSQAAARQENEEVKTNKDRNYTAQTAYFSELRDICREHPRIYQCGRWVITVTRSRHVEPSLQYVIMVWGCLPLPEHWSPSYEREHSSTDPSASTRLQNR